MRVAVAHQDRALGAALGATIADQRRGVGLTRQRLALAADVSPHTLMKIEQGYVAQPGIFTVTQLAAVLRVPLDELVTMARARIDIPPQIGSLGYEGRTLQQLIAEAHRQGIDCVVDVRLNPISRKPGLSKTKLGLALQSEGIEYVHRRSLGNPKENRHLFAGDELEVGRERFRRHLQTDAGRSALADVAALSRERRVGLLCFEAEERRCHRAVVAEEVLSLGSRCRAR